MRRTLCALFLWSAVFASAANFKLFLSDGSYQVVREYKITGDRVRYFSVERGDWEEIPSELLDLKKTESERADRAAAVAEKTRIANEEDKAVRAQQEEVLKIPRDAGVYMLEDGKTLKVFKIAESVYHTNKGRAVLKAMSPIPLVAGKGTVELAESHSLNLLKDDRPDLYLQLADEERFALIKVTPKGAVRVAERVSVIPVTQEAIEEMDIIETFRKQLTEGGLYKLWPKEPLTAGEYAVIEYTPGKLNAQIWDFAVKH